MYKKDDYVMLIHPEQQGLAKIVRDPVVPTIVNIQFCHNNSKHIAHTEFIRHATEEEIKKFYKGEMK